MPFLDPAPPLARTRPETPHPRRRIDALDAARGVALAAMALYHATWDLGYLRLTPENGALTPAGRWAAHAIAGSFLLLVGVGLVLMNRDGVRARPYLARLARIGGAALAVTLATLWLFPEAYVFFGILHCIAAASVLGLPFVFLPPAATAAVAALVLAAPWFVHVPALDAAWLLFLGLGARPPVTNDWVPLFPWFGMVLAGVAVARAGLPRFAGSRLAQWRARGRPARLAALAGRHSLAVYLVHQLLLLALLTGVAAVTGPHPRAGVSEFRRDYAARCVRTGGADGVCRLAARCTADALRREGLWGVGAFTVAQRARAQGLSQACYAAAEDAATPRPAPGAGDAAE